MNLDPKFLLMMGVCYSITITIETLVLIGCLSKHHPFSRKVLCGVWLTACTYPVVWLVLPELLMEKLEWGRGAYLLVAETFAPVAECVIFWLAFRDPKAEKPVVTLRDYVAITLANLASFVGGEVMYSVIDLRELLGA